MFATIVPLGKKNDRLLLDDVRKHPAAFAEQELCRLRLLMPNLHAQIFCLSAYLDDREQAVVLAGLILLDHQDDDTFLERRSFEELNKRSHYAERPHCRDDLNVFIVTAGGNACRQRAYRVFYAIHRIIRLAGEG